MKIRRLFLLPLFVLAFLAATLVTSEAQAFRCALVDPLWGTCLAYQPDYPPGGRDCTGNPGPGEMNIYSNINYGGFCVTAPRYSLIPNWGVYLWGPTGYTINSLKQGPPAASDSYTQVYSWINYGGGTVVNPGNQPDTSSWYIQSSKNK